MCCKKKHYLTRVSYGNAFMTMCEAVTVVPILHYLCVRIHKCCINPTQSQDKESRTVTVILRGGAPEFNPATRT